MLYGPGLYARLAPRLGPIVRGAGARLTSASLFNTYSYSASVTHRPSCQWGSVRLSGTQLIHHPFRSITITAPVHDAHARPQAPAGTYASNSLFVSSSTPSCPSIPVIDLSPLLSSSFNATTTSNPNPNEPVDRRASATSSGSSSATDTDTATLSLRLQHVVDSIFHACSTYGFFYVTGHGVSVGLQDELLYCSRRFFDLSMEHKMKISVQRGGLAWRGYMPLGGELTHGETDHKEGLYLGPELSRDHHRVQANTPLHGPNLFPDSVLPDLRPVVLHYIDQVSRVGHALMQAISLSFGQDAQYMYRNFTGDPIVLFRLWNYPPQAQTADNNESDRKWGVGEHTDYGFLTILKQDQIGGLQTKQPIVGWLDIPPIPNTFVVNVGDMLDRMTGGVFKSRPHRVRLSPSHPRLSCPLFFDPGWDAPIYPLSLDLSRLSSRARSIMHNDSEDASDRWSKTSIRSLEGFYKQYLVKKVAKVFPDLTATSTPFNPAKSHSTRFAIPIPLSTSA